MDNIAKFGYDICSTKAYAGYYLDTDVLRKSASGGMASFISEMFIKNGGCVFGVRYSDDFRNAEYAVAKTYEELSWFKGSKYTTSRKEVFRDGQYISVFVVLQEYLEAGRKVLFIGLGCDVGAAYKFCEKNSVDVTNLYTIDLVCQGPTLPVVAKQYIDSLEKSEKSKIVNFSVRYKKKGWVPAYLKADFANGSTYEKPFYETDYGKAFSIYSRESCFDCKFKGENHQADLTVGDFGGIDSSHEDYNPNGVSIAFVRESKKGEELLGMIDTTRYYLHLTDTACAMNGNTNYYRSRRKPDCYDKFSKDIKVQGLHYAVVHSKSIPKRITGLIKRLLPENLVRYIKKKR